jgi:integrase
LTRARRSLPCSARCSVVQQCVAGKGKEDFLLTRGNRPVNSFRGTWATLCAKIGRPDLLVHDLRRSAACALRRAGVAESVVMETGGWSTAEIFRRYAIVSNRDKAPAMAVLEQKRIADKAKLEAERQG